MRSNAYCYGASGTLRVKVALNYVFIQHLNCFFSDISAAITPLHVLLASSSASQREFSIWTQNIVRGVIQIECCSLCCSAESSVLRSDEMPFLMSSSPSVHICHLLLHSEKFDPDMFGLDPTLFTSEWVEKHTSVFFDLETLGCCLRLAEHQSVTPAKPTGCTVTAGGAVLMTDPLERAPPLVLLGRRPGRTASCRHWCKQICASSLSAVRLQRKECFYFQPQLNLLDALHGAGGRRD